ncbi:MAG: ATPase domain-containing protein [Candidatus Methanoperedens sp.]
MVDPQIMAAIIAVIISAIGVFLNFWISLKKLKEKKQELDAQLKIQFDKMKNEVALKQRELEQELLILRQKQMMEILKKRIEVYPKLWAINLKYWRNWYLLGKKRDKTWINNWLAELNEFNEHNGLFFSGELFEKFSDLRDILTETNEFLEKNNQIPQEKLFQISEVISGKSGPGLSTIMKDDLGSYSGISFQKRDERDYKEEFRENDKYFDLSGKHKRKDIIKAEIVAEKSTDSINLSEFVTHDDSNLDHSNLKTLNYSENSVISNTDHSLKPTGISVLDRILGGGINCGSVVNISADARSMAEVFLYQFAQMNKTYYFTTEKKSKDVQYSIYLRNLDYKNINFIDIHTYSINNMSDEEILNLTENYIEKIALESQEEPIIIFDNFSFYLNLNIDSKRFRSFMNHIINKTYNSKGISYLYTFKQNNKFEDIIYSLSDFIFDIELEQNGEKVTNQLSVLKNKMGAIPQDRIRFKFSDAIQIDTTKEIV